MEKKPDTNAWILYEIGKQYNVQENLYEEGTENFNYYHGRQWEGLERPKSSQEPITLNIIKPIVKYKSNIVNSNNYEIVFNPNAYDSPEELEKLKSVTKGLSQFVNKMWEKNQGGKKVRSIVKTACINSEGILYFYMDDDLIQTEEIEKNNIYYGNENSSDIQSQPYILVVRRLPVQDVIDRARKFKDEGYNHLSEEEINTDIVSDREIDEQSGKEHMLMEVSPACLVVEMFERDPNDGKIYVSESTRTCEIMKKRSTECEMYPFAHFIWEEEKGYSRGTSEVRYLIDNQREINKTATRRAIAIKIGAYPKLVVDGERIKNPKSLTQVGSIVELTNMRADDVNKTINYLRPTQLSPDAQVFENEIISQTRELSGASEVATGTIDPTQASGKAILAVQQAQQQPINEQLENFKYFLEDSARIMFEMIRIFYSDGLSLFTKETDFDEIGNINEYDKPFKISQKELEDLDLDIKIDITPTSPYDKYQQEVFLENALFKGLLTLEEFVDALPDNSNTPKTELMLVINRKKEKQRKIAQLQMQMNALNSAVNQAVIQNGGGMLNEMQQMSPNGNEGNQAGQQQSVLQM